MPYTADISRANPACFLFLIDQSGSMELALAGQPGFRKMDQAATALNGILNALSLRCSQGMEVRDYFHIGVIGYSTHTIFTPPEYSTHVVVRALFQGSFPRRRRSCLVGQVVEVADDRGKAWLKNPMDAGGYS